MNASEPPVFTSHELRSYRGQDKGPIYLAVQGIVYDVSSSRHLYGPGGPYHVFAGRECARALALFSLSEKDCVADVLRLDEDAQATLDEWIEKFRLKYSVVGRLSENLFRRLTGFFFRP